MRKLFYLLLVVVIFLSLQINGYTKIAENKTEFLSENDKIIIASLINLSYLLQKKTTGIEENIKFLKRDKSGILGYVKDILQEISNLENSKKTDYLIDIIKKNSDNKYFKDYADSIKDFMTNNSKIEEVYKKWYSVEGDKTGFLLIKNGEDKKYKIIIYKINSDKTDKFGKSLNYYQNFVSILPVEKTIFQDFPIVKKVIYAEPIYLDMKIGGILLYPPLNDEITDMARGIIVFEGADEKQEYAKIITKNAGKIDKKDINSEMITKFKIYHLIFHSIGPFFTGDRKSITVKDSLKEFFLPVEEIKTELLSYLFVDFLKKQGELKKEDVETNFMIYLMSQKDKNGLYPIARNFLLNFLLEKGGIVRENNKIILNKQKITPALSLLLKDIIETEYKGDYIKARQLIKKYGVVVFNNREK